jgi:hypothetical protein
MLAGILLEQGNSLIGKTIITQRFGYWPGGPAVITELRPDPQAPEIVFQVRGTGVEVKLAVERGLLDSEEIGVFEYEEVEA